MRHARSATELASVEVDPQHMHIVQGLSLLSLCVLLAVPCLQDIFNYSKHAIAIADVADAIQR